MMLLIACVTLTLIVLVVSIVEPIRCLFWLSVVEVLLKFPVRRSFRRGDVVRVIRPDHPLAGQDMKVCSDYNDRLWLERELSPRWRTGVEVAAGDVVFVKRFWLKGRDSYEGSSI